MCVSLGHICRQISAHFRLASHNIFRLSAKVAGKCRVGRSVPSILTQKRGFRGTDPSRISGFRGEPIFQRRTVNCPGGCRPNAGLHPAHNRPPAAPCHPHFNPLPIADHRILYGFPRNRPSVLEFRQLNVTIVTGQCHASCMREGSYARHSF